MSGPGARPERAEDAASPRPEACPGHVEGRGRARTTARDGDRPGAGFAELARRTEEITPFLAVEVFQAYASSRERLEEGIRRVGEFLRHRAGRREGDGR